MTATIRIYDPEAEPQVAQQKTVAPPSALTGKTVGFIDNGWRSFGVAVPRLQELLRERHGAAQFILYKKPWLTRPLAEDMFQDLVTRADAVVVGLGN